jgi:hypothetical protein
MTFPRRYWNDRILLMMKLLMAFGLFPLNQKPDCLWMGATAIRFFNHLTSATRLSQGGSVAFRPMITHGLALSVFFFSELIFKQLPYQFDLDNTTLWNLYYSYKSPFWNGSFSSKNCLRSDLLK